MAILRPGEAGTLESMASPINITRIVEYDIQSRYLVLAKLGDDQNLSAEQQDRLKELLDEVLRNLMSPAEVAVFLCPVDFDLEFYQIGGGSS